MVVEIEPLLVLTRHVAMESSTDDDAKSLLSWCIFHLLEKTAKLPKELTPAFQRLGEKYGSEYL